MGEIMLFRSKAPLRLGLAGGGSDVSPYSDIYGGAILNATIGMYAYASLEIGNAAGLKKGLKLELNAVDMETNESSVLEDLEPLPIDGKLNLHKGVFNRILRDYPELLRAHFLTPVSVSLSTYADAPPGSGLGTSSTMVVAILGVFAEWLKLPLGEYDLARLAYEIERIELKMAGGKQDQYAATFGGVNFMEFSNNNKVIVNPLRIRKEYLNELEFNIVLYYSGTSRLSSKIIEMQANQVLAKNQESIEAMHKLKEQAVLMKEALLMGRLERMGEILDFGWQYKKQMAEGITNEAIDEIYETAMRAGSTGGKIMGAGGGGFMTLYCPGNTRYMVIQALNKFGGAFRRFQFTKYGLTSWKV